jgi:adenylate cyclase class 2
MEIEAKIKVPSHDSVLAALRKAKARFVSTVVQTDTYFDTAKGELRAGDSGLRIREIKPIKGPVDCVVTFKGPRAKGKYKSRPEHETSVGDAAAVAQLFKGLGLSPVVTIQKRRSRYHVGRCNVELDELPLLGAFVEIEGPSEAAIGRVIKKLGIEGPHIHESYLALVTANPKAKGKSRFLLPTQKMIISQ